MLKFFDTQTFQAHHNPEWIPYKGLAIIPCLNRGRDGPGLREALAHACVRASVKAGAAITPDRPLQEHSNRRDDRKRDKKALDLFPRLSSGRELVDIDRLGVQFLKGGQLILHHCSQTQHRGKQWKRIVCTGAKSGGLITSFMFKYKPSLRRRHLNGRSYIFRRITVLVEHV